MAVDIIGKVLVFTSESFSENSVLLGASLVTGLVSTPTTFTYQVDYSPPIRGRHLVLVFVAVTVGISEVEVYPTGK